jgi:hypothetical protein
MLIWFLVFASGYGINSGNNLHSVDTAMRETKIPGSDFGTVDGQCLSCKNTKSSITDVINLPVEFNMNQKNEKPTGTTESEPHLELADKIMNNFILGNWGIPAEIIKQKTSSSLLTGQGEKKSTDAETVWLQLMSNSMWYGPCLGSKDKKSSVNDEQVKQEPAYGGMWFGPRLGSKEKKSYDNEWFKKQRPFWILPETMNRPPKYGFLPQLGQDTFTEIYPAPVNNIIRSELDNYSSRISDDIGITKYNPSGKVQFASQLGHKQKKATKVNTYIPQEVQMWTLLEDGNNKPPEYDFTPRLGRDLYEKGLTLVSKSLT